MQTPEHNTNAAVLVDGMPTALDQDGVSLSDEQLSRVGQCDDAADVREYGHVDCDVNAVPHKFKAAMPTTLDNDAIAMANGLRAIQDKALSKAHTDKTHWSVWIRVSCDAARALHGLRRGGLVP